MAVSSMGKISVGRFGAKPPPFRESDFAGRPPQEQAKLSGSLNQLSEQLAATRKLLQEIEDRPKRTKRDSAPPSDTGPDGQPVANNEG
jgi:hypothetical protein